jgi:hypothetical protein
MIKTYSNTMKQIFYSFLLLILIFPGCERAISDLEEPDFPTDPNVFIDGFSGGLNYAAFGGSVPTAFQVDTEVTYDNTGASMRFEIPEVGDPRGSYAGGTFFTSGPRDLTGYNALTFYAKASESVALNIVGFGNDLDQNTYTASVSDFRANSNWKKYIIPIPNPEVLTQEKGMFFYSFGPIDNKGYTVWIDEVKFEDLGTIAQPRYKIFNGEEKSINSYTSIVTDIEGLVSTYNLPDGSDQDVDASAAYFDFTTTDETVASVNNIGEVTIGVQGTATVTASVGDVNATGSLVVNSQGVYNAAPTPTEDPADVISIFSDTYSNVPVGFYNGYYEPFQTTTSNDFEVNGDNVLNYENFNFVGIEFNPGVVNNPVPTIDGSEMTNFKVSIFIPNNIPANSAITISLRDFGADNAFGGTDDVTVSSTINSFSSPPLVSGQWLNVDINISNMATKSNLGQIVFDADAGTGFRGSSFFVDNIYLYK